MGSYHGIYGFQAFSRRQAFMTRGIPEWINKYRYQPSLSKLPVSVLSKIVPALPSRLYTHAKNIARKALRKVGGSVVIVAAVVGIIIGYFSH